MTEPVKVTSADLSDKLVKTLDTLLQTGNWQSSLFLKNAGKRLGNLKQEAEDLKLSNTPQQTQTTNELNVSKDQTKVYISLYQIDGDNLQIWLHTIKALSSYNISRPTYADEKNVKELIASKADSKRHGYVIAIVNENEIINIDPPLVDSFGHEMLILKEGSITPKNLMEFIHSNKRKYAIKDSELSFIEEVDRM